MKSVCCAIISVLYLVPTFFCEKNNVCSTVKDYYTIKDNPNCRYDPAADSNVVEIIAYYGYPVEIHKAITPDGYILTLFRIPNNNEGSEVLRKAPVFLQPGLYTTSGCYFGREADSLPFLLANAGHDVWLGNYRGTEYSEEHVNLTVYTAEYWDYSLDEIALYDVPTQLNYVAEVTGQRGNIVYIGHSLGTSLALGYSAAFPEEAKETLKMLILLGPAAHVYNIKSPLLRFPKLLTGITLEIIRKNDLIRLVSHSKVMKSLTQLVCLESPLLMERCIQLLNLLFGGPKSQMDPEAFPVLLQHSTQGGSFRMIVQISDAIIKNSFRRYNYGLKNLKVYGTVDPPDYDLSKIEVPVFIMHADSDWVGTVTDSRNLYKRLSPKVRYGIREITDPYFNHYDFLYGRNAKTLVYDYILRVLDNYSIS